MGIKKVIESVKKEARVLQGEETKDKLYASKRDYPDELTARQAFARSKEKLFHVDGWSDLPGLSSTFQLHDQFGKRKSAGRPQKGDYIWIDLPGPLPDNWVKVIDIEDNATLANFVVRPSENPQAQNAQTKEETEHFFSHEATSTFQVELEGNRIIAKEIGKDEAINNKGEEAGGRAVINTLIAQGGWAFFQKVQWEKLTDYLVHTIE